MDTNLVEKHFGRVGARVRVVKPRNSWNPRFGIDIAQDAGGEYFAIEVPGHEEVELLPLEVRPDLRHLLLMVRRGPSDDLTGKVMKDKYLCGHDERHWFVAGVGDGTTNVLSAMESLRPGELGSRVGKLRVKNRLRRRNSAFVRQGEWFFVPSPNFEAKASLILRHEPISRGDGGKPHWCGELFRDGGTPVYVCQRHPRGVMTGRYLEIIARKPEAKNWNWRIMRSGARVYARGRISHPDHKTIELPFWHQVLMNSEHREGVIFLD